ncbi:stabilizer of axonemal microtubules 4 isoform X3 [Hemitrygon akajei]
MQNGFDFCGQHTSLYKDKFWSRCRSHEILLHNIFNFLWQLLQDNYLSVIKKHFVPYGHPDGKEDFPHKLHSIGSGFMRTKPLNFPFLKDMKEVHTDTKDHGPSFITGIQPKHVPLLHQIQSKDPVMQENRGHGPLYMSTEYNAKYKLLHSSAFSQHKTVGKKENTGFTEGSDLSPITFHHPSTYQGDQPGYCTDWPTGISLTKSDYLPSRILHGDEFLPAITNRSNRGTSFTKKVRLSLDTVQPSELHNLPADKIAKIKKEDPAEYLHRTYLNDPSSINTLTYTKPEHKPLQAKLSGHLDVGNQESTGFTSNENGYVYPAKSATDTDRFLTNYKLWHNDKTPKGEDREGWTRGGIQKQLADGFVRSSIIHKHGPDYNITENLHRIHPHVARQHWISSVTSSSEEAGRKQYSQTSSPHWEFKFSNLQLFIHLFNQGQKSWKNIFKSVCFSLLYYILLILLNFGC